MKATGRSFPSVGREGARRQQRSRASVEAGLTFGSTNTSTTPGGRKARRTARSSRSLLLTFVLTSAGVVVSAQSPAIATDVPREELQKVVAAAIAARRGDQAARVVDAGGYNVGVSIVRRTPTLPGPTVNHTKITEVYYIVSGSATLMTGGDVTMKRRSIRTATM